MSCLDVDKAQVEIIERFPLLFLVKGVHNFLHHIGFYQWFIKDFSKITRPMWSILEKEVKFDFDALCLRAFEMLKHNLIEAFILHASEWELPFELMCNASDVAVGAVLRQRKNKVFYSKYHGSKTLDSTQANYKMIEKEMLAEMFAFNKFILYLCHDPQIYPRRYNTLVSQHDELDFSKVL